MDRGIPTEEVLQEMRDGDPPIHYIVGTPKGRLTKYEKRFFDQDWQKVREGVEVKELNSSGETYFLARSLDRVCKERSMRRRPLRALWNRLHQIKVSKHSRAIWKTDRFTINCKHGSKLIFLMFRMGVELPVQPPPRIEANRSVSPEN